MRKSPVFLKDGQDALGVREDQLSHRLPQGVHNVGDETDLEMGKTNSQKAMTQTHIFVKSKIKPIYVVPFLITALICVLLTAALICV